MRIVASRGLHARPAPRVIPLLPVSRAVLLCLAAALAVWAGSPTAAQLAKEAKKAERSGDVVRAYLLYSQAAALDPKQPQYWSHAVALRTRATLDAKVLPLPPGLNQASSAPEVPPPPPPGFFTRISDEELAELRRIKPPPELTALPGTKTLDLRGDARAVFDQVARAFGLGTAFDNDYEAGRPVRLRLEEVDYRAALHAVEAATGSFVFPAGQRLIMVVKDTPQKRTEREPTLAVTVPVPFTVTPQEAQEVGRAVQQAMEIQRLAVDTNRHMVLIKDRISKVRPAQALFEQLAHTRAQVMIDLDFLEVDRSNMLTYGLLGPSQFPITYLGRSDSTIGMLQSLSQFFVGHSVFGLGIVANIQLFATLTQSYSKTLLSTQLRALDGQAASFHVGDKYPVTTGGFLGGFSGALPSFNFEDLGVVMKVTPHVHGAEEVSLDVEAELKVLSGQSLNGVPLISTRKLESKVRLKQGEWAVVAGLLNNTDSLQLTGPPLLIRLPFLHKTDRNRASTEVLLLMKPRLLNEPPENSLTRTLWIGSEARLEIPL